MAMGLIRNHYVGRTFIQPQQAIRHFSVKIKLNPVRSVLEGRRVILIDDSIVRGTTSRKIVKMVRAAGAKEVHMRIACPPTISPCFYGVDTPNRSELIAATHTLDEVRDFIEADSLAYLSLEGLLRAVTPAGGSYCLLLHRRVSGRLSEGRAVVPAARAEGRRGEGRALISHGVIVQARRARSPRRAAGDLAARSSRPPIDNLGKFDRRAHDRRAGVRRAPPRRRCRR